MIILTAGASHTGKEKNRWFLLKNFSVDIKNIFIYSDI